MVLYNITEKLKVFSEPTPRYTARTTLKVFAVSLSLRRSICLSHIQSVARGGGDAITKCPWALKRYSFPRTVLGEAYR